MIRKLDITLLIDNRSSRPELLSEHGLSVWIEADGQGILFDTGQSDRFLHNAVRLGIDVHRAHALVLSHGHYDHTGGLPAFLSGNPSVPIYGHPGITRPRYSRRPDAGMKPIGIGQLSLDALQASGREVRPVMSPIEISDSIGITGPIPRISGFEDTGGDFSFDLEGRVTDPVEDDLSMWFRTERGLVVVTGCCHSGLVNTLEYVRQLSPATPIYTIVGGLHLLHASSERMERTCAYLDSTQITQIVPCHCTGEDAVEYLARRLGKRVQRGCTGVRLTAGGTEEC